MHPVGAVTVRLVNVEAVRVQGLEEGRAVRARCVSLGQSDSCVVSSVDPDMWPDEVAEAYRAGFRDGARPACGAECDATGRSALLCYCVPPF